MIERIFVETPFLTQIIIGFIALLWIYFNIKFDEKSASYGPTILTTTGILATFLGIAIGLLDLDPQNIQSSLPQLLGGLKTAFFASVVGVAGALLIKLRHFIFGVKQAAFGSGTDGEITAADLAAHLKGIQQALVGNDEATLVSQLKLLRVDINERLEALRKAQLEALQKLSEMGSASLVEALRDVIRDFNAKLTEQFGENFKQLNEAVGKLLTWQQQYKDHIETFTQRQTEIADSMRQSTSDYGEMVTKSGAFTKTAQDLGSLLTALETQKLQLVSVLTELANLLQAASGSLPQIETKLTTLTNELSKSLLDSSTKMESTVQEVARSLSLAVSEQQKEVGKALAENVQLIRNSIQSVNQDFTKINQTFNQQLEALATKTKDQVSVLDKALSEELQKSLESLGRQLAALSEKFANDYTPLANSLRLMLNSLGAKTP